MAKSYNGRWEVIRQIEESGQAHIFEVMDQKKEFANSVLKRIKNPKRSDRFLNEVKAYKTLDHPNIIKIIDHSNLQNDFKKPDDMFIVMPYITGGNLTKKSGKF
ncbi:MAG TPA: protein kinase [bacterium]|nr:protein kinase [bacterium]